MTDASDIDDLALRRELEQRLAPWGQEHLLAFWQELSPDARSRLADEIESVDFALLRRLATTDQHSDDAAALLARAVPPPAFRLDSTQNAFQPLEARAAGQLALRNGQIGVILVAGGQGSRLGFDHPKGMYSIGPVSGASLFQILFEQIVALARRYGVRFPLFLMTSSATHAETIEYLDHVGRFGLPAEDLFVFSQGALPAVDAASGRVLLSDRGNLALSPDGHGGMLAALASSGGLTDIRGRGIQHLFYLQIDNPLVKICDPEFLGYHLLTGSEMTTLAVGKREPRDKVGNLVQVDGQTRIVEYTEFNNLDPHLIDRRDAQGRLLFWAGNTAVHAFDVQFLERVANDAASLPYHIAHKKIPYVDAAGRLVQPESVNALKFERFIFDLLPAARRAVVVECDEAAEFAPVKNATGRDSPETVRAQMIALHANWLRAAGASVAPDVAVEISPLFALDAQELRGKLATGLQVNEPTYFREP